MPAAFLTGLLPGRLGTQHVRDGGVRRQSAQHVSSSLFAGHFKGAHRFRASSPAAGGGKRGDRLAEAQAAEARACQGDWTDIVAQGDPEDLEKVGHGQQPRLEECTTLRMARLHGAVISALVMCMVCLLVGQQQLAAAITGARLPSQPHHSQSVSVSRVGPRCDAGPSVVAGGGLCRLSQQCPPQQHLPWGVHHPCR